MTKRMVVAVIFALMCSLAAAAPAGAHYSSKTAGGSCGHHSSSSHSNGAFMASLAPYYSANSSTCLSARLRVRGLNIDGMPAGWRTAYYYGDPGKLVNSWADDLSYTKHDVLINSGGSTYWGGLTIWH